MKRAKKVGVIAVIAVVAIIFVLSIGFIADKKINEYKNSNAVEITKNDVESGKYDNLKDGDLVSFNNVLWIVLERQGNKCLLMSKYGIASGNFSSKYRESWENSYVRKELEKFYDGFSAEDKSLIQTTTVKNGNDNTTTDHIFLLSKEEVEKYLSNGEKKTSTGIGKDNNYWWLRTAGLKDGTQMYVNENGKIVEEGRKRNKGSYYSGKYHEYGQSDNIMTRPAMWITVGKY